MIQLAWVVQKVRTMSWASVGSRGTAIWLGRQAIVSRSSTGVLVVAERKWARVDLPEPELPRRVRGMRLLRDNSEYCAANAAEDCDCLAVGYRPRLFT